MSTYRVQQSLLRDVINEYPSTISELESARRILAQARQYLVDRDQYGYGVAAIQSRISRACSQLDSLGSDLATLRRALETVGDMTDETDDRVKGILDEGSPDWADIIVGVIKDIPPIIPGVPTPSIHDIISNTKIKEKLHELLNTTTKPIMHLADVLGDRAISLVKDFSDTTPPKNRPSDMLTEKVAELLDHVDNAGNPINRFADVLGDKKIEFIRNACVTTGEPDANWKSVYNNAVDRAKEFGENLQSFFNNATESAKQKLNEELEKRGISVSFGDSEFSDNAGNLFGAVSVISSAMKIVTDKSEDSFLNKKTEIKTGLKSGGDLLELIYQTEEGKDGKKGKTTTLDDRIKEKLRQNGLFEDLKKETTYYDEDGKVIDKADAPKFYKRVATIAEISAGAEKSASLYKGSYEIGDSGVIKSTLGEAEVHSVLSAGMYVVNAEGERKFSPGVKAEIGGSVTALEVEWNQQWLGDENLGLNSDVKVTAGKAEAKADATVQILNDDGSLDVQLGAGGSAELIGGEVEGSVGVNVLGGEVGVKGSVNYGIGAHAEVGYRDGVLKFDIGASVGVGVSVGMEIDLGGMVDTVVDGAESVVECVSEGWNDFTDGVSEGWNNFTGGLKKIWD